MRFQQGNPDTVKNTTMNITILKNELCRKFPASKGTKNPQKLQMMNDLEDTYLESVAAIALSKD